MCIRDSGDVNKSPWQNLCIQLNQKNIVSCSTRKSPLLDIILVPTNENAFSTLVKDPIANSDHNTIYIIKEKNTNTQLPHEFFDYRSSHLNSFKEKIDKINWNQLSLLNNANEKILYFNNEFTNCMKVIPKISVKFSRNDKMWITPLTKHLINLRWKAFRNKQFHLYDHYKQKVRQEIYKSKKIWYAKCKKSKKGLWQFIQTEFQTDKTSIDSLSLVYENEYKLATEINKIFSSFQLNTTSTFNNDSKIPNYAFNFLFPQ